MELSHRETCEWSKSYCVERKELERFPSIYINPKRAEKKKMTY